MVALNFFLSLRRGVCAAVATVAVGLGGCTIGDPATSRTPTTAEPSATAEVTSDQPPTISVTDGATAVNPGEAVVVSSLGHGLSSVTMTNDSGEEVAGELSADGRRWATTENLGYGRSYTVTAKDANGTSATSSFTTITVGALANMYNSPIGGSTVGVGQVISLRFDYRVTNPEEVKKALKVTAEPATEGAWAWINPYEVRWRPRTFWAAGTTVTVDAQTYGLKLADGVYGDNDAQFTFTIGARTEAIVDDHTKTMTIYKDGAQVKTMPVSLGEGRWPTPHGTYIVGDQHESLLMDSTTYGLAVEDGGYKTPVQYATQMSWSGVFVHAAPWSVWAQGNTNVSHGCVNVSTDNAKWFMDNTIRGDIVTVKNTVGGPLSGLDGLGDWQFSWEEWKADELY